jgi:hypothetical protein
MRRVMFSVLVALSFVAIGCGGDNNPEPPDAYRPDGGPRDAYVGDTNATDGGHDGGGSDAGSDANDLDAASFDTGTDAPADAFSCNDPTGCYRCPPTTNEQFLNHCAQPGVTCEHFPVTVARLPHLNADGTVPALP